MFRQSGSAIDFVGTVGAIAVAVADPFVDDAVLWRLAHEFLRTNDIINRNNVKDDYTTIRNEMVI